MNPIEDLLNYEHIKVNCKDKKPELLGYFAMVDCVTITPCHI